MKNVILTLYLAVSISFAAVSQSLSQLSATDAVTGNVTSLGSLAREKGIVLIFHDPSCPFAKLYEERIRSLRNTFQSQGMAFALVHPQVTDGEEVQRTLRKYIDDTGLKMPYLLDEKQLWTKAFQASKIPEVVLLMPTKTDLEIVYKGAIDNNAQAESAVTEKFLEMVLRQAINGQKPSLPQARAVGCNIRTY